MKKLAKKHWKVILIIVVIILIIVGDLTNWYGLRWNYPDLPSGVDKKGWRKKYEDEYKKLSTMPAGEYRTLLEGKAASWGVPYREAAHRDAVHLTNQRFGTNVSGKEWSP